MSDTAELDAAIQARWPQRSTKPTDSAPSPFGPGLGFGAAAAPFDPAAHAGALQAAHEKRGPALLDDIRATIARLGREIGSSPRDGIGWSGPVRDLATRRARLRHDLAWLETLDEDGSPAEPYEPPDPEEIEREVAETVVCCDLSREWYVPPETRVLNPGYKDARPARSLSAYGELPQRLDAQINQHSARHYQVAQEDERLTSDYIGRRIDLEGYLRDFAPLWAERWTLHDQLLALKAVKDRLAPALAEVVTEAVQEAGGSDVIQKALGEVLILARPTTTETALDRELAEVEGKLADLGDDEDESGPVATQLQAQRRKLADQVKARKAGARTADRTRAQVAVAGALAGDGQAYTTLATAAAAEPRAFPEGFSKALADCTVKAALATDPVALALLAF